MPSKRCSALKKAEQQCLRRAVIGKEPPLCPSHFAPSLERLSKSMSEALKKFRKELLQKIASLRRGVKEKIRGHLIQLYREMNDDVYGLL